MKIGIENYPFIKFSNIGPKVFLTRLTENIKDRKLAQIKSSNLPWIHFDTYAWSTGSILGIKGAALQGLEIMIEFIDKEFS